MPDQSTYHACCGNSICSACVKERDGFIEKRNDKPTCPFCRKAKPQSAGEISRQLEARIQQNDVNALFKVGVRLWNGENGMSKDRLQALDYWIRAVELGSTVTFGSAFACREIACFYVKDTALAPMDKKRAFRFEQVAAMRGNIVSRGDIGHTEYFRGNHEIGIRHWKIAAEAGHQMSLDALKKIFFADGKLPGKEFISKESLDNALRVCHEAQVEVNSEERAKHSGKLYLNSFRC
jgi:TPR repeat protein